jgi:peptidoglycan/LPS O-acetylase OafA/YrhL
VSVQPSTPRRPHLWQVDLLRIAPMIGVVAVHALVFSVPQDSVVGGALLMALHVNREAFFFISAFVLFYATGAYERSFDVRRFWRRRYPLVVIPYLAWSVFYWGLSGQAAAPLPQAAQQLGTDLGLGWFHLYFLLVTMQLYLVFPLLAWVIRRTWRWHWALLIGSAAVQVGLTAWIQYGWESMPWLLQQWFAYAQNEVTSYQFYFLVGGIAAARLPALLAWFRSHRRALLVVIVAAIAAGEAWYGANLLLGEPAIMASGVLQPALVLLVVATLLGLWLLGDRWLRTHPLDGRLWRLIRWSGENSFGIYLVHMLPLWAIVYLSPLVAIQAALGLTQPAWWPVLTLLRFAVAMALTAGLVVAIRWSPLSKALTGRSSLLDGGRGRRPAERHTEWQAERQAVEAIR